VIVLPLLVLIVILAGYLLYTTLSKENNVEVITLLETPKENE